MDVYSLREILRKSKDGCIRGNYIIRGEIPKLEGIISITGELGITARNLESLGDLEYIGGDFWVSISGSPSKFSSLGNLKKVEGNVNLAYCEKIESLGLLEYVGGNLNLRETSVLDLGRLSFVKGNLLLPAEMKNSALPEKLQVGGYIKYWKHQKPYYSRPYISMYDLIALRKDEVKQGKNLISGKMATEIGHISDFTSFGRNCIEGIYPFIEQEISNFCKSHKINTFLDAFFDGIHPYRKKDGEKFDSNYYKPFYSSEEVFAFYDSLYSNETYICNDSSCSIVFDHAIREQISKFFRPAEDAYRESIGLPKIGEGWVSETDLFHKVKNAFPSYNIIQHAHPQWLGRQHLDIYFPHENLAIEYQGAQHFKPVSIFGGEKGFQKTQERDKRKFNKCKENSCKLLYVDDSYSFAEVITLITKALEQ